jgi:hypothetical protein
VGPSRIGEGVSVLDEEPLLGAAPGPDQGPLAAQLVALQREDELARLEPPLDVALRAPGAPVPDDDRPGPVLAPGDHALEVGVLHRVVLHLHRQALVGRVGARPHGHGPGLEDAPPLQPEVPVQAPRRVLLHHEAQADGLRAALRVHGPEGFRGPGGGALGAISGQRIGYGLRRHRAHIMPPWRRDRSPRGPSPSAWCPSR